MINLLPDDYKSEIRAGRLNVIFVNYLIMTVLAGAFMAALMGLAFVTLSAGRQDAQNRVAENDSEISQYASVKSAADAYRADLATAKQILGNSTNYSDIVFKIADAIPSGVVITNLSLDAKTLGTPTTLNILARDKTAVLDLKTSMQQKTDIFTDVSFQQVTVRSDATEDSPYQYSATVNVTLNKAGLNAK